MLTDAFIINNKHTSNKNHISNGFCKYFTGVGEQFASGIPTSINNFDHYLKRNPHDKIFYFKPTNFYKISEKNNMVFPAQPTKLWTSKMK